MSLRKKTGEKNYCLDSDGNLNQLSVTLLNRQLVQYPLRNSRYYYVIFVISVMIGVITVIFKLNEVVAIIRMIYRTITDSFDFSFIRDIFRM